MKSELQASKSLQCGEILIWNIIKQKSCIGAPPL